MSQEWVEVLGEVSSTAGGAQRVANVVTALVPPAGAPSAAVTVPAAPAQSLSKQVVGLVPGAAGAAVGYKMWKKHPALGALAGHALGANLYSLYKGDRKRALCQLAVEAAGVLGALKFKKHPVMGWLGGVAAGAVATSFVDGSASKDLMNKLKAKF